MSATLFLHFALLALPVLALAVLAGRTRRAIPLVVVALAALVLGLAYLAGTDLLGRPKPLRLATLERGADSAEVIAATFVEGEAIYLWLRLPGAPAPRAYVMPWSQSAAKALFRAQGQAEQSGAQVVLNGPFGSDSAGAETGLFDVVRLPPLPPKPGS
jgi:hypothetical protein